MSVWCLIPGISWDRHHQTSFALRDLLFISCKHQISVLVQLDLSLYLHKQHQTDLLKIAERLVTHATCSYAQYDSSCITFASWLLLIPFWLEAHHIFHRISHIFSLSSFSPFPHQHFMAPATPHQSVSRYESSWMTGASSHAPPPQILWQCRHQSVNYDAATAATWNMTPRTHTEQLSVTPKAVRIRFRIEYDVTESILQ